ncbi:hypothetical protein RDWZM_006222 [Blomia tropicalis]|uniref:TPPP family protein n=1 Tax=Blomia tropicalis TaxID=40697 RepID=A0A9Q0M735_BLOTA|nr:hypothetical protein RDWZM_006222 [Blomia tropicalis]
MCLIETYLQMATEHKSVSNGGLSIDDNNNKNGSIVNESDNGTKTPPNTPQPQSPPVLSLPETFKAFAKFGDIKSSGEAITLSNSDKWFKQAKIIDGKKITTTDTGIYWKQVAKTKKSLSLNEYNTFLETLAKMKKLEIDDLKDKLQSSGPPSTNKTTAAGTSGAFGRLTDHTKYTGSHKQRFDESGKGRGKAGREDVKVNTGYVTGFKA